MRRAIWGLLLLSAVATAQSWLEWSEWNGNCEANPKSIKTRFRVCKPAADVTAAPCFGDSIDVVPCTACPAQGTWGEWSVMDGCSENCGAFGRKFRIRECQKPIGCPNLPCQGEARELDKNGAPCDNRSPCILPKKACHADYKMSIDPDELRNVCVKK
ncbi:hypothetical protein PMAYCL1PPCAC_32569, partial [Pristionchus mayeri]